MSWEPRGDTGLAICDSTGKAMCSKGQAKSLAKRVARRAGVNIKAYVCPRCGGWHVGTRRERP